MFSCPEKKKAARLISYPHTTQVEEDTYRGEGKQRVLCVLVSPLGEREREGGLILQLLMQREARWRELGESCLLASSHEGGREEKAIMAWKMRDS